MLPAFSRLPASLQLRPMYRAAVPMRPLQFQTLGQFVDVAHRAIREDAAGRGLSALTLRWWEQSLHLFTRFLSEAQLADRFLSGDVEQQLLAIDTWVRWLRTERRVSHTTVRTYFGAVAAVIQRLETGYGMVNPFALVLPPRAGRPRPRVLERAQAETLITAVTHFRWRSPLLRARNLAIVGLMLYAGLRRGEVLALGTGDLNLEKGCVVIRRGKGKNGGKPRTAYLPPQLRTILALYLRERDRAVPRRTHPQLITLQNDDRPASAVTIARLFRRLSLIAGCRVSPHMLRHTYATLLRQAGVADRVSMDLMGHQSLSMLTRYSHVFEPEYEQETRKLQLDVDLPVDI